MRSDCASAATGKYALEAERKSVINNGKAVESTCIKLLCKFFRWHLQPTQVAVLCVCAFVLWLCRVLFRRTNHTFDVAE